MSKEKEAALADLNSVERSLSDMFRRYETMKSTLDGFKKVSTIRTGSCFSNNLEEMSVSNAGMSSCCCHTLEGCQEIKFSISLEGILRLAAVVV